MCKDVGPGGFVPPNKPETPPDPPQTFISAQPRLEVPLNRESEPQTSKF